MDARALLCICVSAAVLCRGASSVRDNPRDAFAADADAATTSVPATSPQDAADLQGPGDEASTTTAASEPDSNPQCSGACAHRKLIERDAVQSIKQHILEKLGLKEPPRIPPHLRYNPSAIDVLLDRKVGGGLPGASEAGAQGDQADGGRPSIDQLLRQMRESQVDDDSVKPRKIIAFAETGTNDSKQCIRYEGNQIHFFRFSKEVMSYKVANARLWVYLQAPAYYNSTIDAGIFNLTVGNPATGPQQFSSSPPHRATSHASNLHYFARGPLGSGSGSGGATEPVALTVVWAKRLTDGRLYASFLTSVKHDVPADRGKWVHVDLTKTIADWFRKPDGKLGLVLSAADVHGREVKVSGSDDGMQTPFIELTPSTAGRAARSRRSLGIDCDGVTEEKRCCRYPLTIDFEAFEWDWIIAPKTYEANYCAGDCPYVFLQKYPHSYIIQVTNRTICCGPRKMSSISMLYFNTEHNILHSTLPGMTVEKCGCS